MCASYCHLPLVLVLQSKIVSLNQVEMGTNQVKQHFAWWTLLEEREKKDSNKRKLKNTAGQRRKVRCIHQASADNGIDFSTLKCLNIRSLHIYLLSFNRISRKIVSGSSFLKLLISPTNSRPLTWCEASGWCLMNSLRSEISWKHWEIRKMPQEKCASE